MDRSVEQTRIVLEDVLRAVAVVNVEIDHRDAGNAMDLPRLLRPDRDIVEQAEAHGLGRFGVMARWAGGAERVARFPRHDGIDGGADGASGTQRRLAGTGRQDRVVVQLGMTLARDRCQYPLDVQNGMDAGELLDLGPGRLAAVEEMES